MTDSMHSTTICHCSGATLEEICGLLEKYPHLPNEIILRVLKIGKICGNCNIDINKLRTKKALQ